MDLYTDVYNDLFNVWEKVSALPDSPSRDDIETYIDNAMALLRIGMEEKRDEDCK